MIARQLGRAVELPARRCWSESCCGGPHLGGVESNAQQPDRARFALPGQQRPTGRLGHLGGIERNASGLERTDQQHQRIAITPGPQALRSAALRLTEADIELGEIGVDQDRCDLGQATVGGDHQPLGLRRRINLGTGSSELLDEIRVLGLAGVGGEGDRQGDALGPGTRHRPRLGVGQQPRPHREPLSGIGCVGDGAGRRGGRRDVGRHDGRRPVAKCQPGGTGPGEQHHGGGDQPHRPAPTRVRA